MSLVFDFANIAARVNRKPEPVKPEPVIAWGTTHTLTIADLPSHTHTITGPGHTHGWTTGTTTSLGEHATGWPAIEDVYG